MVLQVAGSRGSGKALMKLMTTPDALAGHWVDRAPAPLKPYLRLARLDRPAGYWLLYWPCAWGVLLAPGATGIVSRLWLCLLFFAGAVAMRGAGCVWNDILDRDIDAQVARTRSRPLPSGAVSVRQAFVFMLLLCLAGLAVLLLLPPGAQWVALGSLPLVALYPLMKRITWWPQLWLGLTFNWGALVGYAAWSGGLSTAAFFLYAAGVFWTLGYDTIYALQDKDDDERAGVRSSARAVGKQLLPAVGGFYLAMTFSLGVAFSLCFRVGSLALIFVPAAHLAWQWRSLARAGTCVPVRLALDLFRSNVWAGALVATVLFAARFAASST
jgi:4-hydroxybenzoate polyprenyltransferase